MSDETANTPAYNSPYKFNGKELDEGTGMYYYGARYYDPRISVWMSVDPLAEKLPTLSPYVYCTNNPVIYVDVDGRRPFPIYLKYGKWHGRVDSYYGPRNTGIKGASKFHKGLDINYSGGGNTDFGTPILATHDGIATIDNDPNGSEGRTVVITSPDRSFRTKYFHLSEIKAKNGDLISESDNIGKMGGSANGNEYGRKSHLHYEIQKLVHNKWESYDPTEGKAKSISNIVDPQTWISPDNNTYRGKMLPSVTISAPSLKNIRSLGIPYLQAIKLQEPLTRNQE